jgi:cytochrome c oxidase cbb3-type subunit III
MKKLIPSYVRVPVIFAMVMAALEYFIDSGDKPAFIKYPMVLLFLGVFLFLLIAIEIVSSAVDKITYHMLSDEQKEKLKEVQSIPFTESKFYQGLMKKLTRSKDIEQEADVMLDHDYDGIKELDNVLPPWWVNLFYGCVIFAIIYLVRFQVFGDYNQTQEYEAEVELAQAEIDKFKEANPSKFDESTVALLTDAESLSKGKEIFTSVCAACHRADGGGQIGPNLTDEYWINNGGGIKNIFHTVANGGREGKGMVPWKGTLKPEDIQKVASYVVSLQGTNPKDAKPVEEEAKKWVDETATPTPEDKTATDSTKVATNEVAVK